MSGDGLDGLRRVARKRWGNASPFRLGIVVGEAELRRAIQCPYIEGSRGWEGFHRGMKYGEKRARELAQADSDADPR